MSQVMLIDRGLSNVTDDGHMTDFDRFGAITASVVAAILRVEGETRSRKWAWRVITGREKERPANWDQERGLDHEEDAIAHLESELCALARPGRYVRHPSVPFLGASPDGFIFENGLEIPIEAKCPRKLHTCVPPMYYSQIQTQLECCDVEYGYFVSWVEDSDAQFVTKVARNCVWWSENFPVIEAFYNDYVLADVEPPKSKWRKNNVGPPSQGDSGSDSRT